MEDKINISELICTRISHDLIGNIGAFANAVELLEDEDDDFIDEKHPENQFGGVDRAAEIFPHGFRADQRQPGKYRNRQKGDRRLSADAEPQPSGQGRHQNHQQSV